MTKTPKSKLNKKGNRLQNLLSKLGVGVYRVAEDGSFLYVNKTLAKMFGYETIDEFMATKSYEYYADIKDGLKILHEFRPKYEHYRQENLCKKKDGTLFWIKTTSIAVRNSKGDKLYFDGIVEDITQQKEAERILLERDRLLAHTLDDLNEYIGIIKPDGTVVFSNNTALALCDYKPEDVIGKNYFDLEWWGNSEDAKRINRDALEKCKKGETVIYESEVFRKKDGARVFIEQSMHPIFDEENNLAYIVPQGHDITRQKTIERKLRQAQDELEKTVKKRTNDLINTNKRLIREISYRKSIEDQLRVSLKEKNILLTEIHHRVKNNLQIVSSLLAMTATRHSNQKEIQALNDSRNRIQTMAMIHEHLYESEGFQFINLFDIIQKIVSSVFGPSEGRDSNIRYDVKPHNLALSLDQAIPCSLILNELLSNVQRHAYPNKKNGGVQVIMELLKDNNIFLSVKDSGIGLPDDMDLDHIKTLGLKLVMILAKEQLKGDIKFNSHGGTTVAITFKSMTST